ncbi:unnamed protein product [Leuciscus chuanchicus]
MHGPVVTRPHSLTDILNPTGLTTLALSQHTAAGELSAGRLPAVISAPPVSHAANAALMLQHTVALRSPLGRGQSPDIIQPLATHAKAWAELPGVSKWVLSIIERGYSLQFGRRPQRKAARIETTVKEEVAHLLRAEIAKLLSKGAIEPLSQAQSEGGMYSRYFLVPKKDGGLRPILDLRRLNKALLKRRFRMLTTRKILSQICQGDWFMSIDLKDAYFQIQIASRHRRFLRFAFEGQAYQYTVLPFGLSLAPRVFTMCMDAALAPLRLRGIRVLNYLDDWLVLARSQSELIEHRTILLDHLENLGLTVNWAKSSLSPSQKISFLGTDLDSLSMTAQLSPQRRLSIQRMTEIFRHGVFVPLKKFQRMLGLMASASSVLQLGLLRMRPLQYWLKARAPRRAWTSGLARLKVDQKCVTALKPWTVTDWYRSGVSLGTSSSVKVVSTDASTSGWGALLEGRPLFGQWSEREKLLHINCLEMMAVDNALRRFCPQIKRHHVLVRSDNMSVVAYINHQGGILLQEQGCAGSRLASLPALCVSPCHAPTPGVRANQGERMPSATRRPILDKPSLVSSPDAADEYRPVADTGEEGSPLAGERLDLASSPGALVPTCVGHQRVPVNLPAGVLNTITQARAPSTRRLYSSKWSVFTSWCTASGTPPSRCGVTEVLSFLQELLDKGRTPSTLKVYVAAIAAFAEPSLGQSLGRNDLVIRFLRGAKRLNPPRPPSVPVWDLSTVLEAMKGAPFEPIESIDLKLLSFKTVFLLALASVKRIGDLQALSVSATCMEFGPNDSRVILKPKHGYVPKSLNTPFRAQVISLSALPVSEEEGDAGFLCPVRALRAYVSRSSVFRQTEQLFVLFSGRSKGLAASKQSLSRWIVDAIALAYTSKGLQCPIGVKAHSTRGMASSWAWSSGIALQDICMAAGWASPSTFIRLGQLQEAVDAYSEAIRLDPFLQDSHVGRGKVFMDYGDNNSSKKAQRDFLSALHLNPLCLSARICLAYNLQVLGFFQRAWNQFTVAIEVNPKNWAGYEGRAVTSLQMDNMFAALQDINSAIKCNPLADQLFTNRGLIQQFMGDKSNAMKDYQTAISLNPGYALAYFNAANLFFYNGQFEQACEFYSRAFELDPSDESVILNRAITHALLRKVTESLQDFNEALCLNPQSAHAYFNRANLYCSLRQFQSAERDLTQALMLQPGDALLYKLRADVRGRLGWTEQALEDYRNAVELQNSES